MAFPADPLDVVTELLVDGRWRDISGDVREEDGISIHRGSASEDRTLPPARCSLTLADHDHRYNPRNPLSSNYGLLGRNTPMRVSLRQAADDFEGRTVASGWGTSAAGHVWTSSGTASNYAVSGGAATHLISTAVAFRLSYLATVQHRDVDVFAVVDLAPANITGGDVEPINLVLRGASTTDYYMVRVVISSAEVVTVKLMGVNGPDYTSAVTVPLTYSGQQLAVRAQFEGQQFRAKVWAFDDVTDPDSTGEPYAWQVSARVPDAPRAGWVGVRSGVGSGNTNLPLTFSYTRFEVRSPRVAGEVSSWPPRTDTSENDRYVPIEASGVLRRLGQGQAPLRSVLRRSIPALPNLVAYWPCEDGRDATFLASALHQSEPITVAGETRMAAFDGFAASDSIPTLGAAIWTGRIPGYAATGAVQTRFLMAVPAAGTVEALLVRVGTTGSVGYADVYYGPGGSLRLFVVVGGSIVLDTGWISYDVNGKLMRVSVELSQSGSNVTWRLSVLEVGASAGGTASGTITGQTVSAATQVNISLLGDLGDTAIGHITVESAITSLFDLSDQLDAYAGETATDRMTRLCAEEGVEFGITGDPDTTALMGPQRPDELLSLLAECAEVDQGLLGEFRGTAALRYRTRRSFYNQTAVGTIDHDAGQLAPPFAPTDDDLATRNDITVRRPSGASAQAVLESGRMSVLDPAEGGAGRYTTTRDAVVYRDSQLQYLADWLLALGTVDSQRYPTVTVDLASVAGSTLFAGALSLDCGDQLDVVNLTALGIYDDVHLVVLGYSETLRGYDHRLAVNCGPAGPYRVLVWDSSDLGRLDSGTSTLAGSLTSGATSFSVATADDDDLWTTTPAHFPLTIAIGGEHIEISAITGSSSPQTFTVASGGRAANRVAKAHSAGAEVHLANPNRYAL